MRFVARRTVLQNPLNAPWLRIFFHYLLLFLSSSPTLFIFSSWSLLSLSLSLTNRPTQSALYTASDPLTKPLHYRSLFHCCFSKLSANYHSVAGQLDAAVLVCQCYLRYLHYHNRIITNVSSDMTAATIPTIFFFHVHGNTFDQSLTKVGNNKKGLANFCLEQQQKKLTACGCPVFWSTFGHLLICQVI